MRVAYAAVFVAVVVMTLLAPGCGSRPPQHIRVSQPTSRPLGYRDSAGRPQGFVIDALNAAAQRAGVVIDWVIIGDTRANNEALRKGEVDIVAGMATPERRREFFVSDAWWSSGLTAVIPAASSIRAEEDLHGKRLAIPAGIAGQYGSDFRAGAVVPVGSATAGAEAVCKGTVDAAIMATMFLRELLYTRPGACHGVSLRTVDSGIRLDYVLVARPELRDTAKSLRDELDAITLNGELVSIAARHPPMSTPQASRLAELLRTRYDQRISTVVSAAAVLVLVPGVVFLIMQAGSRRRLREANEQLQRDLRAREAAEAALRNSEARFRALFDAAPQTVVAADRSSAIVFANRKSQEMFGHADLIGRNVAILVPERFRQAFLDQRTAPDTGHTGLAVRPEFCAVRADGSEFPAEIRWGGVETDEGLALAFIGDISEQKALQQQLLQSQKLDSLGQLAGGVAHDFNNLLTVISGYSEMVLEALAPEDTLQEPVSQIARAADRAGALTRQLLAFSRRQNAHPELVSLNELLRNVEKMLRRLIGEDIDLHLRLDDDSLIYADPGQIEQVVVNLAVNARDAMRKGGRLTIQTTAFHVDPSYGSGHPEVPPGRYVMLAVSDNGTGMTPEVQARIFEPFFTTKEQGKRTGLGLSTVYGIVRQSGGTVLVHSVPGEGTTFKILLPIADGFTQERGAGQESTLGTRGNETILVAEDEPEVRRFIAAVLTANGYVVLEAANGRDAIATAARHKGPLHLVLSDVVMPEMGGLEVAAGVKTLHPQAAVVHMSGYTDRAVAGELEHLIDKPFTASELLAAVRRILGKPAEDSAERFRG